MERGIRGVVVGIAILLALGAIPVGEAPAVGGDTGAAASRAAEPPTITDTSPSDDSLRIALSDTQEFSVDVSDPDTDRANLSITWYVDDTKVAAGNGYTFDASEQGHGDHTVQAVVSDGDAATADDRHTWVVEVLHPPRITSVDPNRNTVERGLAGFVDFRVTVEDPDSDIADSDIRWSVDGTEVASGRQFTFETTNYAPGRHRVRVRVGDGSSITRDVSHTWTVIISQPPRFDSTRPDAGTVTLSVRERQRFSVEVVDPDTTTGNLVYEWYLDGQRRFTTSPKNALDLSGGKLSPGEHTLRVVVSDDSPATGDIEHTWTIEVLSLPRIESIEPTNRPVVLGKEVTFTAEATDPNGHGIATYAWTIGGKDYRGKSVTVTFTEAGVKDVNLTVTTEKGISQSRTEWVNAVHAEPKITFYPRSVELTAGGTALLSANATDPANRDVSFTYRWTLGGTTYTGKTTKIGPMRQVGQHTVELSVVNTYGGKSTRTIEIVVKNDKPSLSRLAPNRSVSVRAGTTLDLAVEVGNGDRTGVAVQFRLNGSPIKETTVATNSRTRVATSHTFERPGVRTVTVRAVDGHGATAELVWRVRVESRPPRIETVSPDRVEGVLSGTKREFRIEAIDPDGTSLSYRWLLNGTPVGDGTSHVQGFPTAGTYNLTVIAEDGDGDTAVHTWNVTATSSVKPPVYETHISKTIVRTRDDVFVGVSMRNPTVNRRTFVVEFAVNTPDGMQIHRLRNVRSASQAHVIGIGRVEPGTQKSLQLGVEFDESLLGKTVRVGVNITYFPEGNPRDFHTIENGTIEVHVRGPEDGEGDGGDGTTVSERQPGFTALGALAALLLAALAAIRRR